MSVYALIDLKKGDEVTTTYTTPVDMYKDRKRKLQRYKFECDCRLCELDRTDPCLEQRERILTEYHEKVNKLNWATYSYEAIYKIMMSYVKKLRATYKNRKELRFLMYWPLSGLMIPCVELGRHQEAIDAFLELREMGVHLASRLDDSIWESIVECFNQLGKPEMAKKFANEFFEISKIRTGADKQLFKKLHRNVTRFLD